MLRPAWLSSGTPCTGLDRPTEFQEIESPEYHNHRHMNMAKWSALCADRLYPPGNIPGTHLC